VADLNLSGRLIYLAFGRGSQSLDELNLATGTMTTLFDPPDSAWINSTAVSPDSNQLVLAYAPPPPEGEIAYGYTDLYIAPLDQLDRMQPVLERTDPQESYFSPVWSPDGLYIYYVHLVNTASITSTAEQMPFGAVSYRYDIERMGYPGGQPERLIENAMWPRLSPDGSKLAYVSFDWNTYVNDLYVADADGANSTLLMPSGTFIAVDAPLFTADGGMVIFSAVGGPATPSPTPAPSLSWLDQLLGVQIASAHNIPSDWWRVPVTGGQPEQMTQIYDTGMYGALSPDGTRIAFVSAYGISVMNPDGSDLQMVSQAWVGGSLDWIP
jgi:Tol biopolymer transport system component